MSEENKANQVRIVYADLYHITGFHSALGQVAREKIYLEMIEPPEFE